MMDLCTPSNLFIFNNGGESGIRIYSKTSFNNLERTAGTVKQWKTVASGANG
jgi:hypothetical protein